MRRLDFALIDIFLNIHFKNLPKLLIAMVSLCHPIHKAIAQESQILPVSQSFQIMKQYEGSWEHREVKTLSAGAKVKIRPDLRNTKIIAIEIVEPVEMKGEIFYAYKSQLKEATQTEIAEVDPGEVQKKLEELTQPPSSCPPQGGQEPVPATSATRWSASPMVRGMDVLMASHFRTCLAVNDFLSEYPDMKTEVRTKSGMKKIDIIGTEKGKSKTFRYIPNAEKPLKLADQIEDIDHRLSYINEHPTLNKIQRRLSERSRSMSSTELNCLESILQQPPIYGYGAKPKITSSEVDVTRDMTNPDISSGVSGKVPASSVDCSGAVIGAMALAGLRLEPDQESYNPDDFGVTNFNEMLRRAEISRRSGKRSDSCFSVPEFDPQNSLRPGDLITVNNRHIVMIERVGKDPLGLTKVKKQEDCEEHAADPRNFDFVIAQSASVRNIGLHKVTASAYLGLLAREESNSVFLNSFTSWVQQLCERGFTDNKRLRGSLHEPEFYLARHESERPGCADSRKHQPVNQRCISDCI